MRNGEVSNETNVTFIEGCLIVRKIVLLLKSLEPQEFFFKFHAKSFIAFQLRMRPNSVRKV